MSTITDLETLGREAGCYVAGPDAVEAVEAFAGTDLRDEPIYHFNFLINQERSAVGPGLLRIRLLEKLLDDLVDRGEQRARSYGAKRRLCPSLQEL